MTSAEYFLVLSSGYCGSLWLAASLDKHPDISCTCNALIGLAVPHDSGFDFGRTDPGVVDAMMRDQSITGIDDLFSRVAARKPARAVGDVHGYRVSSYQQATVRASHRPATLVHLVRHPAVLLERVTQEQIHRYKSYPRMRQAMTAGFQDMCQTLRPIMAGINWQITEDMRGLGFLFAISQMQVMFNEVQSAPDIKLWTFEDLMSRRETFADLVQSLTNGSITADEQYLDTVFDAHSLENSGRYRKTGVNRATRPDEVFAAWSAQEQEAFRRLVRLRNLPALYQSVGYDFAFAT